jgi:hypothetical protein
MAPPQPQSQQPDQRALSTMLEFHDVHRHAWGPQELREMLCHQLAAPLRLSLGTLSGEVAHQISEARPPVEPLLTLRQLLHHPQPPLELLKLVKRFAKLCRSDRHNPLPSEIVMLLYYASIAAALVRTKQQISGVGPTALHRGLTWLGAQPWVDDEMRSLLKEGLNHLPPPSESGSSAPAPAAD